jgi:N6-adenosine-specific RNA methylase IME4
MGLTEIACTRVNLADLRKGEAQENLARLDFTVSEGVAVQEALEPEIKETRIGHRLTKEEEKKGDDSSPFPKGKTRVIAASFTGYGFDTLRKGKAIVEAARKEPEKFGPLLLKVDDKTISVNAAFIQLARAQKHRETPSLPIGEYDIIYADPPWKYDFCLEGDPNEQYSSLETDEICALPVPLARDAILFLWGTNPKLKDALKVMDCWGFRYITNLVWVKQTSGLGYYSMAKHELLLIGKKGDIPPPSAENRPVSAISADATGHSRKPEVFYEIIEKMYPNRKYLELFSRNERQGWVMWGDEVGKNQNPV